MNNKNEKIQNDTCPKCGHYSLFNGVGIEVRNVAKGLSRAKYKEFELYKCRKCGCEWEVEED